MPVVCLDYFKDFCDYSSVHSPEVTSVNPAILSIVSLCIQVLQVTSMVHNIPGMLQVWRLYRTGTKSNEQKISATPHDILLVFIKILHEQHHYFCFWAPNTMPNAENQRLLLMLSSSQNVSFDFFEKCKSESKVY